MIGLNVVAYTDGLQLLSGDMFWHRFGGMKQSVIMLLLLRMMLYSLVHRVQISVKNVYATMSKTECVCCCCLTDRCSPECGADLDSYLVV